MPIPKLKPSFEGVESRGEDAAAEQSSNDTAVQIPQGDVKKVITQVSTVGQSPRSSDGSVPSRPGSTMRLTSDVTSEYVAGGGLHWYAAYVRALPQYVDDITQDFGDDIYEQMLKDPHVVSALNLLKSGVLQGDLECQPVDIEVARQTVPDATPEMISRITSFCQRVLDDLETPMMDVLWDMLDGIAYGNKIAEIVYQLVDRESVYEQEVDAEPMAEPEFRVTPGTDPVQSLKSGEPVDEDQEQRLIRRSAEGKPADKQLIVQKEKRAYLEIKSIKVKPRRSLAFVVDDYMNIVGFLGNVSGQGFPVSTGTLMVDPSKTPNMMPVEKFMWFTFRSSNSDPRGRPLFRPSYNAWWFKQQIWPEYLKYLSQFASASLIGYLPEDAQGGAQFDAITGMAIDGSWVRPDQEMLATMLKLRNSSAAVFPNGAKVEPLQVSGDGEPLLKAFDMLNREIVQGALHQTRATMEAEHGSKADSQTGAGFVEVIIQQIKGMVVRMIRRDLLKPLVKYNFGEPYVSLAPSLSLGSVEQGNFGSDASAVATLVKSGFLHPSQYPWLDARIGAPARPPEAIKQQVEAQEAGRLMAKQLLKDGPGAGDEVPKDE